MKAVRTILIAALSAVGLAAAPVANAGQTLCVYDPAGKAGNYYSLLNEFTLDAGTWGAEIEIKAYTDEQTASKDYQAGACDGVLATGVRMQRLNNFPSTIEAIGAIPDYSILKQMVKTLATSDGAAAKLKKGEHETVGFVPVGAAYLFVRDRNVDTVAELGGLRIATMDYDKAAPVLVERVGGVMVGADLGSIGPKFNNGGVDACYMSAPGYAPFELHRGLQSGGGIIKAPLAQGTLQLIVRHEKFPEGFSKKSRMWFYEHFDESLEIVLKAEGDIPSKYWIDIPAERQEEWDDMFLDVRVKLRDDTKAYDGQMLGVLRSLRCNKDSSRAECAEKRE